MKLHNESDAPFEIDAQIFSGEPITAVAHYHKHGVRVIVNIGKPEGDKLWLGMPLNEAMRLRDELTRVITEIAAEERKRHEHL